MISGHGATNGHGAFHYTGFATLAASVGSGRGVASGHHEDALRDQNKSQQQNDGRFHNS